MKKIFNYYLSMALLASLFLVVTSCGDDTETPVIDLPSIELEGVDEETVTVEVGQTLAFTVNVVAPGGFNTFVVNQTIGEDTQEIVREGRTAGVTTGTFEYDFSFTPTSAMAGETIIFDFVVVDDGEQEATETLTVIVNETAVAEYETVLLGGQLATEPSFFDAVDGERMGYTEANDNPNEVDFLYYYVSSGDIPPANTIGSPADESTRITWANTPAAGGGTLALSDQMQNDTRFKRVTTAAFNDITSGSQVANAFLENENPASTRLTNLIVGETFAFMLDEDRGQRYGVVEVVDIQGTQGSDRAITLNVRVQAQDNVQQ